MFTIGFTTEFYTLWDVQKEGNYYIKNLSKDFSVARSKMKGIEGIDWKIDLDMRGESTWELTDYDKIEVFWEDWQFTYGKLKGEDMRTCDDVWQLNRVYQSNANIGQRRRVFARRRLIELGELQRFTMIKHEDLLADYCELCEWSKFGVLPNKPTWTEQQVVYGTKEVITRYATPKQILWYTLSKGHHEQDGARVTLMLQEIDSFSFETYYGTIYVVTYKDDQGRMFKYMGSSPPMVSPACFGKFKATINHSEYKGVAETKLKRISPAK